MQFQNIFHISTNFKRISVFPEIFPYIYGLLTPITAARKVICWLSKWFASRNASHSFANSVNSTYCVCRSVVFKPNLSHSYYKPAGTQSGPIKASPGRNKLFFTQQLVQHQLNIVWHGCPFTLEEGSGPGFFSTGMQIRLSSNIHIKSQLNYAHFRL